MMERMTSFVLVCSLGRFVPTALHEHLSKLKDPLIGDHGPIKVRLTSERILKSYNEILSRQSGAAALREGPLVLDLLDEIVADASSINPIVMESLNRIQGILREFFEEHHNESAGSRVRKLYKSLHVAGPYFADESHERVLGEIVRELTLMNHGSLLFDVVKTPKFLATAPSRNFGSWGTNSRRVFGETLLVPDVDPVRWTVKSRARVPIHAVEFGPLQQRHLQIILFSPAGETPQARYVHQRFLLGARPRNSHLTLDK
jgi:hypothetical protein